MAKYKKVLASLLSVAMLTSMTVVPTYAATSMDDDYDEDYYAVEKISYDERETLYDDVDSSDSYYSALTILTELGIFYGDDKGNFNPNDTITRAEAAAVAIRLIGLSDTTSGQRNTIFTDVPASHWASGVIDMANSLGIVVGYGDGLYGPEDPVKYEEIIAMIVRAMDYDPMLPKNATWPNDVLNVASRVGIKSTEGGVVGKEAPRRVVASLLYSALQAPLMEIVSYGYYPEYALMDGSKYELKTLLSERFDAYILKAVVYATDKTSLSGSTPRESCAKLQIKDGYDVRIFEDMKRNEELLTVYDMGMLRDYLGATITAFIKEGDNYADYDLLTFAVIEKEDDVITIDDVTDIVIDGTSKSTRNFGSDNNSRPVIVYYNAKGDKKSVTLDVEAKILINNTYFADVKDSEVDNDIFDREDATVTLRDTNGDGYYDVLYIDNTIVFVVDEINDKYLKITDANNYYSAIRLDDYYNSDIVYTIKTTTGKTLTFDDLEQYDVLTIKANVLKDNGKIDLDNSDYYEIIVSREVVSGTIRSTTTDENGRPVYTIDGEKYKLVPNIIEELDISTEGDFYLDSKGRIAYYSAETVATNFSYGYITRVTEDSRGIDDTVYVRMVKDDGSVETLETPSKYFTIYDRNGDAHKIRVGATSSTSSYESISDWEDALVGTLVAYKLNSSDELNKIYLPQARDTKSSTFSLDRTLTGARYKASTGRVGSVDVDNNTIVFFIPDGTLDAEDIEVSTIYGLEDDEYYDIEAYHMTSASVARILVVKSEMTSVSLKDSIYVVVDDSHGVNDDYDNVQILKLYYEGVIDEYYVDPDMEFDVERGDVISIKRDVAGNITNIYKLYDVSEGEIWNVSDVYYNGDVIDDLQTVAGYVTYKRNKSITISTDPYDTEAESYTVGSANIYLVTGSSRRVTVELGDLSDVEKYSDNEDLIVFARIYEDVITDIVVYDGLVKSPVEVGGSSSSSTPTKPTTPTETITYIAFISVDEYDYNTSIEDIISNIVIEKYINGVEDTTFVTETSKVSVVGYEATTEGIQILTIKYDGKTVMRTITITVLPEVVE